MAAPYHLMATPTLPISYSHHVCSSIGLVFGNHEVYAGSPPQKHHTRPFSSSFMEFSTGSVIFIMCMMIP
ncbi:hypothetical protein P8452_37992 [Trifolium repens]|nr:hypothetical protein P8452_37992 [Trifolium repens]